VRKVRKGQREFGRRRAEGNNGKKCIAFRAMKVWKNAWSYEKLEKYILFLVYQAAIHKWVRCIVFNICKIWKRFCLLGNNF